MKAKTRKKPTITKAWNKAGKQLQDYYRQFPRPCMAKGKSCTHLTNVMHHHFHWGSSIANRLEEINLIPLCTNCHCSVHSEGQGRVTRATYMKVMRERYGQDWEDQLIQNEIKWGHKSTLEQRDYIEEKLKDYQLDKL